MNGAWFINEQILCILNASVLFVFISFIHSFIHSFTHLNCVQAFIVKLSSRFRYIKRQQRIWICQMDEMFISHQWAVFPSINVARVWSLFSHFFFLHKKSKTFDFIWLSLKTIHFTLFSSIHCFQCCWFFIS